MTCSDRLPHSTLNLSSEALLNFRNWISVKLLKHVCVNAVCVNSVCVVVIQALNYIHPSSPPCQVSLHYPYILRYVLMVEVPN